MYTILKIHIYFRPDTVEYFLPFYFFHFSVFLSQSYSEVSITHDLRNKTAFNKEKYSNIHNDYTNVRWIYFDSLTNCFKSGETTSKSTKETSLIRQDLQSQRYSSNYMPHSESQAQRGGSGTIGHHIKGNQFFQRSIHLSNAFLMSGWENEFDLFSLVNTQRWKILKNYEFFQDVEQNVAVSNFWKEPLKNLQDPNQTYWLCSYFKSVKKNSILSLLLNLSVWTKSGKTSIKFAGFKNYFVHCRSIFLLD